MLSTSVALASCNGEAYIEEQLDSIGKQTLCPDEVVITDDCSSDGTTSAVRRFIQRSRLNIRLIENTQRLGVTKNFEKAISACRGDIILLSDQDDVWVKDKIASVCEVFEANQSAMVVINNQLIVDQNLHGEGQTRLDNLHALGLREVSFNTGCCTSMRKTFVEVALPLQVDIAHDVWINRLAGVLQARTVFSKVLQLSRRHGDNVSQSSSNTVARPSFLSHFNAARRSSAWGAIDTEIMVLEAMRERIEASMGLSTCHTINAYSALERVEHRLRAFECRKRVLNEKRFQRASLATGMLLTGGYSEFSGLKSYFRDLLT